MNDERDCEPTEYTRIRGNVQLGDGPDARGDVTVEVLRNRRGRTVNVPVDDADPTLVDGSDIETTVDDKTFAEWYFQLERATNALRARLGLPGEGDE